MAKPVALSIGCWTGLRAKSFYSCSFLVHAVQIANHQYLPWLSLKFFGWYGLSDTFTKTWAGGLSCVFVVSSFFDDTRLCVTSAWFYPSCIRQSQQQTEILLHLLKKLAPVNDISCVLYLVDPMRIFSPRIWELQFKGSCACANKILKQQYLWTWCQSVVPNDAPRDFGPEVAFGAKFQIPVARQGGREMSTPRPYVTDPFRPLSSINNW